MATAKFLVNAALIAMLATNGEPGGLDTGVQECSVAAGLSLQVKLNNGVSGTSCQKCVVPDCLSVLSEELTHLPVRVHLLPPWMTRREHRLWRRFAA